MRLSASGASEYATVSQSIPIRLFEASKPSIIVSQPSVKIVEGSSATVGVSLSHWHLPSYVDRTVRVSHLSPTASPERPERKEEEYLGCGRSGLTCSSGVTFTSSNYRTPQPFTITAGTDADSNDETKTVTLQTFQATGTGSIATTCGRRDNDATIQVTIVDDDASGVGPGRDAGVARRGPRWDRGVHRGAVQGGHRQRHRDRHGGERGHHEGDGGHVEDGHGPPEYAQLHREHLEHAADGAGERNDRGGGNPRPR